jgi:hypothetical protein
METLSGLIGGWPLWGCLRLLLWRRRLVLRRVWRLLRRVPIRRVTDDPVRDLVEIGHHGIVAWLGDGYGIGMQNVYSVACFGPSWRS